MQDTFWTTELVNEYAGTFLLQAMKAIEAARNGGTVEKIISASEFIASKSPKKEWEIVAFRAKDDHDIYKLQKDGRYRSDILSDRMGYRLEEFLSDGSAIHSVRRLSDDTVWSAKEKAEVWETGRFTIETFEISAGQMLVKTDGGTFLLGALQKLPQPILTTVDGVEILENEEFWIVDKHYNLLPESEKINEFKRNYYSNCFIFSTREAAEKYILENKPLLSLNDVREACENLRSNSLEIVKKNATALVKQKLNQ